MDERLTVGFDGAGEHLYVQIEKSGCNTHDIASCLESACELGSADIGLSGLKDRQAITRQWFSVRTTQSADFIAAALGEFSTTDGGQARVVRSARHSRKLRRGTHTGNAFALVLRDVVPVGGAPMGDETWREALANRLEDIKRLGFPNYIGPQRFGYRGQNLLRARQWFRQPKKRASRVQRSLWLSAARSELFNAVCAARVQMNTWCSILPGEPVILAGSRSFFDSTASTADELEGRLKAFDIHPSAPWWGRGESMAQLSCAELEADVLAPFDDLRHGLERAGMKQERRALRATATDLQHQWLDESSLQLRFDLSPGVYATTLLQELGICSEPTQRETV